MDHVPHLVLIALAVVATSLLSGIFGMAGGMVLMGVFLAIMPLPAAMALHGVTQMTSNGWRAWLWREHIRWPTVLCFAAGAALAAIAFAWLLVRPGKGQALVLLGLTPFAGWLLPRRARLNVVRPAHGVTCGLICTGLQLIAGVSGPVLDQFFVESRLDRRAIVASKAIVQTLGHAIRIAYFGVLLAIDGSQFPTILVPMAVGLAITGTHASRRVLDRMCDTHFMTWSRRLIVVMAAVYLCQGRPCS